MSSLISICRGLRLTCDFIDASRRAVEVMEKPEQRTENLCGLVGSVAMVIFGATEVGALACDAPVHTLRGLKTIEVMVHACNVPVRVYKVSIQCCDGQITIAQALQRGITPLFSTVRCFQEGLIYQETEYLEMSPEERAQHHRTVTKPGSDHDHPETIEIPITESDCKERLAAAQETCQWAAMGEVALGTEVAITQLTDIYQNLMQRLLRQRQALPVAVLPIPVPVPGPVVPVVVPIAPPVAVIPNDDPFNLLALPFIPQELHEDPVLAKFTCPITFSPIRHPVGDPNGVQLYERSAIIEWIQLYHTSPITREPLEVNQLLPKLATAALINSRLQFHSNRLRALAQVSVAHIAPNAALQGAADMENPRLN